MPVRSLSVISVFVIFSGLLLGACNPISFPEPTLTSFSPTATTDLLTDWPPDKRTEIAVIETSEAQTPAPVSTLAGELGIIEGAAPPYNTDIFWSGGNQWNGYVNNVFTMVLAGARGNDHQQGVVIVITKTSEEWFDTPAKDGVLTISSADGVTLWLTSNNGPQYQFDVSHKSLRAATPGPSPLN